MRIAFLTDIHANRQAFEAVLAAVAAQGAHRIVLLGDIVGYGGDPVWCLERTRALVAAGAVAVRGNHDQAATDLSSGMSAAAQEAITWTRGQLSPDHKHFLAGLPLTVREDDRLYVHADGSAPGRFRYALDAADAATHFDGCADRLTFCGHVHQPMLYCRGDSGRVTAFQPTTGCSVPLLQQRRWLAVIGSVGQPRDGDPAAAFGLLDTDTCELTFLRVAYDIDAAAARIRDAGLPDTLATRLYGGR